MQKNIAPIAALVLTIILISILSRPLGQAPALGPFLSPSEGFLQNREKVLDLADQTFPAELTEERCTVVMDSMLVPHIYAKDQIDAYRVQGFLTAKYRLWQMDFISRVAAGRLSEVFGPRALEIDKKQRRKGLARAADIADKAWKKYPISYGYLQAYSEGVNAYLATLSPADWPIEFKLLGYQPEEWTPYKSALFIKHMSEVLSGKEKDFEMTNARKLLDQKTFDLLYPERLKNSPPVIPSEKQYDFDVMNRGFSTGTRTGSATGSINRPYEASEGGIGSNNWAVSPSRTQDGWPLLANDPHLPLTLPSIWYMAHIHTPEINAMGVCFPGLPSIILGFNDHISWGVTNVGQDVLDWLMVEWDRENSTYQWGDETRRVEWQVEEIKVKGKDPVIDSVAWTDFGPIWTINTLRGEEDVIMRWLAHEVPDADEMNSFPGMNSATNWQEFQAAARRFECPPQNFVFASRDGTIGMQVQGRFPFRDSQFGRYIGTATPEDTWKTHIPVDQVPYITNPDQGFLASANQVSTDPTYPYYYLNGDFRHYRARTIDQELSHMPCAEVKDMMALQLSNYDIESHSLINTVMQWLDGSDPLTSQLSGWDGNFEADCELCTLVTLFKQELDAWLYDELVSEEGIDIEMPTTWSTIDLLRDHPDHQVIDHSETGFRDSAANIVKLALGTAREKFDSLERKDWKSFRNTRIAHMIPDLRPFGHFDINCGGTGTAPNAIRDTKGPSWRFVDVVDGESTAYGVYPGGQSGNPGSHYYDNLIPLWVNGEYLDLYAADSPGGVKGALFTIKTVRP